MYFKSATAFIASCPSTDTQLGVYILRYKLTSVIVRVRHLAATTPLCAKLGTLPYNRTKARITRLVF